MNATLNETLTEAPEDGDNFVFWWLTHPFVYGCWFVSAIGPFVGLAIHRSGAYLKFPSSAIRWIFTIEWLSCVHYGPMKWWSKSPWYEDLAINPTATGCYVVLFFDTFVQLGVLFWATVAAAGFYEVVSRGDNRRFSFIKHRKWPIIAAFFITTFGAGIFSMSFDYKVEGWCQSTDPAVVSLKFGLFLVMFLAQIFFVGKSVMKLRKISSAVHPKSSSSSLQKTYFGLPKDQFSVAIRFLVVILTQCLNAIPPIILEFVGTHFGTWPEWLILHATGGMFIGATIDAVMMLSNRRVFGSLCGFQSGSTTRKSSTRPSRQSNS